MVLEELVALEPIFHRSPGGITRAEFELMTAHSFWEIGASGAVYDRETVWRVLEQRFKQAEPDEWRAEDFRLQTLGPATHLLTYLLHQGERMSRRMTLWRRENERWVILYHQGTLVR